MGADGGDLDCLLCQDKCWYSIGAPGGHGLFLDEGSVAVVAGAASDSLVRGFASVLSGCGMCDLAPDGFGLTARNGSIARTSGVTIDSIATDSTSLVVPAVPDDPFLERRGRLEAGAAQIFAIHGTPGDSVVLHLGRQAVVVPDPTSEIDQLVTHDRSFALGTIPSTGVVTLAMTLPAKSPLGAVFFAQADVTTATGLRRTNSLPIVVRSVP